MRLSHFRALSRKQCCKIAAIFPGKLLRFVKQPELRKSHNKINPSVIDQSTGSFFFLLMLPPPPFGKSVPPLTGTGTKVYRLRSFLRHLLHNLQRQSPIVCRVQRRLMALKIWWPFWEMFDFCTTVCVGGSLRKTLGFLEIGLPIANLD